jgi:hypothetical protein
MRNLRILVVALMINAARFPRWRSDSHSSGR